MSNFTINPAWKAYNDLMNEGGEGYNPHKKWIAKSVSKAPATVVVKTKRMLKDESGNLIPEAKLAARLERDIARRATVTDPIAVEIYDKAIAFARAALA